MLAHQNEGRAGLSMWPEGDHEGRIREVPQESWCSSKYINCVYIALQWKSKSCYIRTLFMNNSYRLLACTSFCDCIITGVYFRRLTINHESHEFILESATVANTFCWCVVFFDLREVLTGNWTQSFVCFYLISAPLELWFSCAVCLLSIHKC